MLAAALRRAHKGALSDAVVDAFVTRAFGPEWRPRERYALASLSTVVRAVRRGRLGAADGAAAPARPGMALAPGPAPVVGSGIGAGAGQFKQRMASALQGWLPPQQLQQGPAAPAALGGRGGLVSRRASASNGGARQQRRSTVGDDVARGGLGKSRRATREATSAAGPTGVRVPTDDEPVRCGPIKSRRTTREATSAAAAALASPGAGGARRQTATRPIEAKNGAGRGVEGAQQQIIAPLAAVAGGDRAQARAAAASAACDAPTMALLCRAGDNSTASSAAGDTGTGPQLLARGLSDGSSGNSHHYAENAVGAGASTLPTALEPEGAAAALLSAWRPPALSLTAAEGGTAEPDLPATGLALPPLTPAVLTAMDAVRKAWIAEERTRAGGAAGLQPPRVPSSPGGGGGMGPDSPSGASQQHSPHASHPKLRFADAAEGDGPLAGAHLAVAATAAVAGSHRGAGGPSRPQSRVPSRRQSQSHVAPGTGAAGRRRVAVAPPPGADDDSGVAPSPAPRPGVGGRDSADDCDGEAPSPPAGGWDDDAAPVVAGGCGVGAEAAAGRATAAAVAAGGKRNASRFRKTSKMGSLWRLQEVMVQVAAAVVTGSPGGARTPAGPPVAPWGA
jgi:hypothetical protein